MDLFFSFYCEPSADASVIVLFGLGGGELIRPRERFIGLLDQREAIMYTAVAEVFAFLRIHEAIRFAKQPKSASQISFVARETVRLGCCTPKRVHESDGARSSFTERSILILSPPRRILEE